MKHMEALVACSCLPGNSQLPEMAGRSRRDDGNGDGAKEEEPDAVRVGVDGAATANNNACGYPALLRQWPCSCSLPSCGSWSLLLLLLRKSTVRASDFRTLLIVLEYGCKSADFGIPVLLLATFDFQGQCQIHEIVHASHTVKAANLCIGGSERLSIPVGQPEVFSTSHNSGSAVL
jgi:hypothetical protein